MSPSEVDVIVSSELQQDGVYPGQGQDGDVQVDGHGFGSFRAGAQLAGVVRRNLKKFQLKVIVYIYFHAWMQL